MTPLLASGGVPGGCGAVVMRQALVKAGEGAKSALRGASSCPGRCSKKRGARCKALPLAP